MSLLELTLLGTGTSGCLPAISCITDPSTGCECCLSTLKPEGAKNIRRNTSAFLRVLGKGKETPREEVKTVLIDCGKSFLTSALQWFPQRGFRKIDALIITHPHSDAMSGLDDLRGWTLGGAIQDTMDVYVTQSTFKEIERTYPYLVSKDLATGGGDVPAMNYIIFDEDKPFSVCGVTVTPLPVHHGWYFTKQAPYYCLGFLFNRSIAYLSDVSYIPDETWKLLEGASASIPEQESAHVEVQSTERDEKELIQDAKATLQNGETNGHRPNPAKTDLQASPPPVLIIDCLRVYPHTSHFGIAQAVATARRLKSKRNYMMGFAHRVLHSTWESISYAVEQGERPRDPPTTKPGGLQTEAQKLSYGAFNPKMKHSDVPSELKEIALQTIEEWEGGPQEGLWIRPGFDGQVICVDERSGKCWDSEYAQEKDAE